MSTVIPRRRYNQLVSDYAKDKYTDAVIAIQLDHYRQGREPPEMSDNFARKLYKRFRDEAKATLPYEPEPIVRKESAPAYDVITEARSSNMDRFKRLYEEQQKISQLRSKRIKELKQELEEAKRRPLSSGDAKYFEQRVKEVLAPPRPAVVIPQAALDIQDRIMGSARRAVEAERLARLKPRVLPTSRIPRLSRPAPDNLVQALSGR